MWHSLERPVARLQGAVEGHINDRERITHLIELGSVRMLDGRAQVLLGGAPLTSTPTTDSAAHEAYGVVGAGGHRGTDSGDSLPSSADTLISPSSAVLDDGFTLRAAA